MYFNFIPLILRFLERQYW